MPNYPIMWKHADGRTITIYADRKERSNYTTKDRGFGSPSRDEWPILYRRDVPNLSDEQWTAGPIETGWTRQGVCPNCGQWQHASSGDCLNECVKRGFAPNTKENNA